MSTLFSMDNGLMLAVLLVLLVGYGSIMAKYLAARGRRGGRQVGGNSYVTLRDFRRAARLAAGKRWSRKEVGDAGKESRR